MVLIAFGGSFSWAGVPPVIPSDDVLIKTWESGDGLPSNSATAMVQADDGFLWFGTFNGLVRFNGVRFDVFSPGNLPSLPSAGIVNLHLDGAGRLWVSTVGGLVVREGESWRRLEFDRDPENPLIVRSFAEDPDGKLLLSTFDGLLLVWSGGGFEQLPFPMNEARQSVAAADGVGRWWVVQRGYIGWWDGSAWEAVERPGSEHAIGCTGARGGGVWIVIGREIRRYRDGVLMSRMEIEESISGIWSVFEDSGGNLWICTLDQGVFRIGPKGELSRWDSTNGLAADSYRFAFQDRERSIWLGANDGGLSRIRARRAFSHGLETGLRERNVKSVWPEPEGGVLVATYGGGLARLSDGVAQAIPLPREEGESLYLQSVLKDRSGTIWAGTFADGLLLVDESSTRRIPIELTGGNNIIAMFEDSRGRVWVSGGSGIAAFSPDGRTDFAESGSGRFRDVSAFGEDDRGRILVSNGRGVFRIEAGVVDELPDPAGGPLVGVLCIRGERDGTVWMGTGDARLLRWRAGGLARVDVGGEHGVGSIFSILPDRDGHWWMPTDRGVLRIERSRLEAAADGGPSRIGSLIFSTEDGLPSVSCTGMRQPVCGADPDGRLWFATPRGVGVIDPAKIVPNSIPPPVHIEQLSFVARDTPDSNRTGNFGVKRIRVRPPFDPLVTIPPGAHRIRIDYAAASYVHPQRIRFEVKLDGIDRSWQDVGNERWVEYMELPPGRYVFRVRAANEDGIWNESGDGIALTMRPLIWQILWVRIAGVVMFTGVIAGASLWLVSARAAARRRSDIQFRTLVETAPNAIVLVEADGTISLVNANAEHIFMWNRDELVGRSIDILLPVRPGEVDSFLHGGSGGGEQEWVNGVGVEISGRRKDGREIPLEIAMCAIETNRGRGTLASFTNIEDRKKREMELTRQRNELAHLSRVSLLGELSGALAHELNQPLAAILSNAQAAQQMMKADPIDLAEIREILSDIVGQNKRAGDVIRRLRALLMRGEALNEEVDLSGLVRDVMPLLNSDLVEHGVAVSLELADVPPVLGDAIQLQQVLINLILNGCDAVADEPPSKRNLLIRTGIEEGRVWVAVSDSGPGIHAEHIGTIFEPFFTTKKRGMGLGLAVCRTIVEAHLGSIRAENNRGGGATVRFSVPVSGGPTTGA